MSRWTQRQTLLAGLLGMSITGPGVLGASALILRFVMPASFADARAALHGALTLLAWLVVGATPGLVAAAIVFHRPLARRARRRQAARRDERRWTELSVLAATASIAQVPALGAVLLYLMGAALLPTAVSVGLSTIGVLALWAVVDANEAGSAAVVPDGEEAREGDLDATR